jgi:hypothetical protein
VWTMRSWVRSAVLVTLSAALVGAFAVPALGQDPEPPPAAPNTYQDTLDRLRADLADRLAELRDAQQQAAASEADQPEHSVRYYAWRVIGAALDFGEWAADMTDKQEANAAEAEARQAEEAANQAEQPADQPETETAAPEPQPAPADAQNRADLGLSGTDDQEQHGEALEWVGGTVVDQPGSVVDANGGVVGGQWEPDGSGDEQQDTIQLDAIDGAVGAGTDNRGFNPFGDLFSEQFTTTPTPDLGPEILITPKPDVDLGPEILVTPQPELDLGPEILLPPGLDPGREILLPPDLDPPPDILLPPHDLPGVTDRVALAA